MIFKCKKCGKDMSDNVTQVWINDIILSGRKYIHSDGTEAEYKELEEQIPVLDWSKLSEYESEDYTTASQELACVGNSCEL